MNMKHRSYEKELLDMDDIPFNDTCATMNELNVVNSLLGGHNITCRGVNYFLSQNRSDRPLLIAEIGCGGGDNLAILDSFIQSKGRKKQLLGIDIKQECIDYAKQNRSRSISWMCSDYRDVVWPEQKPDIIFSSLFCHHFTDEQLVYQLKWLKANSRLGFFINDLHRHPVAYHSIKFLTSIFSKSILVKNDGPLSVKRAFKKHEWQKLLMLSGVNNYRISWHWAFRYLICASNG